MIDIDRHFPFDGDLSPVIRSFNYDCEDFIHYQNSIWNNLEKIDIFSIKRTFFDGLFRSILLKEIKWTKLFWIYGNELNRIIFDLSLHNGIEFNLEYDGKHRDITGWLVGLKIGENGKPYQYPHIFNAWYWQSCAINTFSNRDERMVNNLLQVDTKIMFEKIADYKNINPDLIDPYWHELYFLLLKKEYVNAIIKTQEVTAKLIEKPNTYLKNHGFFKEVKDQNHLITLPFLNCLESVLEENQSQFDERLHQALLSHKVYSTIKPNAGKKNTLYVPNSNEPSGFVSMKLLAICCIAYDKGMKINIESDYIPKWIIEKDFAFEKPMKTT
jgi:hypothetical protein